MKIGYVIAIALSVALCVGFTVAAATGLGGVAR